MRIALAAIKYDNYIYVGLRHAWIRDDIFDLFGWSDEQFRLDYIKNSMQGFVDDQGNFLDRDKALDVALKCGQVKEIIGGCLTSEDLW
jgi:hypothetical protein